jgi:hypothetical protein
MELVYRAPAITAEQLYKQDTLRRERDEEDRKYAQIETDEEQRGRAFDLVARMAKALAEPAPYWQRVYYLNEELYKIAGQQR